MTPHEIIRHRADSSLHAALIMSDLAEHGYRIVHESELSKPPSPLPPPPPTMTTAEVLGDLRERLTEQMTAHERLAERYRLISHPLARNHSNQAQCFALALDYLRAYES